MLCVKPAGLAVGAGRIWIADIGRGGLLEWSAEMSALRGARLSPLPAGPVAVSALPDDGLIVLDGAGSRALIYGRDGGLIRSLTPPQNQKFRPVDASLVRDEVWVTNAAEHRIEVFDLARGAHLRSIGQRGDGRGQFGFPLGIAWDGAGSVYVVDMLNARVQVFRPDGAFDRQVGGPGTRVGAFGRPKDVTVGPDGTVFVVDAASQQVHAFDAKGRPLLAFGAPGEGRTGLWLPNSIAISRDVVPAAAALDADSRASYYVLVTEQIFDAGVRVFAWQSGRESQESGSPGGSTAVGHGARVTSPHWTASGCRTCHGESTPQKIASSLVNDLCLSCHDGVKAIADPHPIAVSATASGNRLPADWPVNDGLVGCLTCHNIKQHCQTSAARPVENPALVRDYDSKQPLKFCGNCHDENSIRRLSPHERTDVAGCGLCHVSAEKLPRDGRRAGGASLNDPSPRACLRCHAEHWDYAPGGHLSKPLKEAHFARLRDRVAGGYLTSAPGMTSGIPLFSANVSCYTCHNPHAAGVFPPGSEMDRRASVARDRTILLRANQNELCTSCHTP